jgi:adenylate cyclase
MAEEGFKRKLTAILSADAVGYSRLMAENETATVKTIATYREVISSLIKQHRGRVVDSPGDNILAEFSSVVDAVQCAVAIQNEIQTRNAGLAKNRRMEFRIGINLGDVIDEEDRIYGDGVNVAARLEAMADPSGICVSKTTFDQIETKLPLGYEYLGEQSVKNIPKPVGAYRVLMKPDAAGKVIGEKRFLGRFSRKTAMAVIVILFVVSAGLVGWNIYLQQSKKVEPASIEKMAFPLPEMPSIVVLPFINMSGEKSQEYISDGLTETLITNLSKVPDLFVIARESSFYYKGKSLQIKQISEDLGVRYVLEGSVQRSGNRIRITAQLIDALKGHHLWAEKYDRQLEDFFALQDDIALNVLRGLQLQLTLPEKGRGVGTDNLEAYLKSIEGLHHVFQWNKEGNAFGRQLYQEAIALDPEYADAYSLLGYTHLWDAWRGYSKSPQESLGLAEEFAQKAIDLDSSISSPHCLLTFIYLAKRQYEKALAKAEQAFALDPNNPETNIALGMTLQIIGRPGEAIALYEKVMRLNPHPPNYIILKLSEAYVQVELYDEAIDLINKWIHLYPNNWAFRLWLLVAYIMVGREEDAKTEAAKVLKLDPNFSIKKYEINLGQNKDQDYINRVLNSLRKAGLPE